MKIIHQSDVAEERTVSPKGDFALMRRHISLALGGIKDVGRWGGGHPFDVEMTRLLPRKKNYPYHAHAAQTEHYIVISGSGEVLDDQGKKHPIRAGHHFIFHPGEAHQIYNPGPADLEYVIIADHHRADVTTYPRTGKRYLKPEGRVVMPVDADYYAGEE